MNAEDVQREEEMEQWQRDQLESEQAREAWLEGIGAIVRYGGRDLNADEYLVSLNVLDAVVVILRRGR